mmetsp:Transcript_16304/g.34414  ORF Transcript_16304/g.34414 Transcript_16304/m.34414 type:complete len:320 (-) Transcript_16304:336-1295(-)
MNSGPPTFGCSQLPWQPIESGPVPIPVDQKGRKVRRAIVAPVVSDVGVHVEVHLQQRQGDDLSLVACTSPAPDLELSGVLCRIRVAAHVLVFAFDEAAPHLLGFANARPCAHVRRSRYPPNWRFGATSKVPAVWEDSPHPCCPLLMADAPIDCREDLRLLRLRGANAHAPGHLEVFALRGSLNDPLLPPFLALREGSCDLCDGVRQGGPELAEQGALARVGKGGIEVVIEVLVQLLCEGFHQLQHVLNLLHAGTFLQAGKFHLEFAVGLHGPLCEGGEYRQHSLGEGDPLALMARVQLHLWGLSIETEVQGHTALLLEE